MKKVFSIAIIFLLLCVSGANATTIKGDELKQQFFTNVLNGSIGFQELNQDGENVFYEMFNNEFIKAKIIKSTNLLDRNLNVFKSLKKNTSVYIDKWYSDPTYYLAVYMKNTKQGTFLKTGYIKKDRVTVAIPSKGKPSEQHDLVMQNKITQLRNLELKGDPNTFTLEGRINNLLLEIEIHKLHYEKEDNFINNVSSLKFDDGALLTILGRKYEIIIIKILNNMITDNEAIVELNNLNNEFIQTINN